MFLAMLMISVRRGTPSVTFLADTPAKWKVFSVICVVGSPMDCAATVPIISPGYAVACTAQWQNDKSALTLEASKSYATRESLEPFQGLVCGDTLAKCKITMQLVIC